eukprot:s4872_g2.t1
MRNWCPCDTLQASRQIDTSRVFVEWLRSAQPVQRRHHGRAGRALQRRRAQSGSERLRSQKFRPPWPMRRAMRHIP